MSVPGASNPLLLSSAAAATAAIEIERSLRFNSADSAYLNRLPAAVDDRTTWTWAGWVKRSSSSGTQAFFGTGSGGVEAFDFSGAALRLYLNGGAESLLQTTNLFRDFSAWYHIVLAVDTNQITDADRTKIYVNGVQQTDFAPTSPQYPSSGYQTFVNNTNEIYIGARGTGGSQPFNGYLADIHFIDGQQLDPLDFGFFDSNGIWQPLEYTGTYGTSGFHLPFSDNSSASALGTDDSGNGNDWTVNNISVASGADNDSLRDSPTNGDTASDTGTGGEVPGNYCTWNPLTLRTGSGTMQYWDGNLSFGDNGSTATYGSTIGTLAFSSGKWYFEITFGSGSGVDGNVYYGILPVDEWAAITNVNIFNTCPSALCMKGGDTAYRGDGTSDNTYGPGAVIGDTFGFAVDVENLSMVVYKNSTSLGTFPYALASGKTWTPFAVDWSNDTPVSNYILNCGQRQFNNGNVPSGFKALCTANLDTPTIGDGSAYMDVALDTGANILTSTKALCGGRADFLWIKDRDNNSTNHHLIDIVRDPDLDGTPFLASNSSSSETTLGNYSPPSGNSVGWAWDAGSSTVTNNDGSISAQVRANPTAGFSIVSYTGTDSNATVGHGLGVAPDMIIVKRRNLAGEWPIYHSAMGAAPETKFIRLNVTALPSVNTAHWNDTAPTSTVFTIGTNADVNGDGATYIAYCFAQVEGYSAFGSYKGNGLADGQFVYTGFRPAFVIIKIYFGTTSNWLILDGTRDPDNIVMNNLYADTQDAENQFDWADFLSNGFKLRVDYNQNNGSGYDYIYAAFAENPFKTARAR